MNAKIERISELSQYMSDNDSLSSDLFSYFHMFGTHRTLRRLGMEKSKGVPCSTLLIFLCLFRICGNSIFSFYRNRFYGLATYGKNCFYRLQNMESMDWRRLLLSTGKSFFRLVRKADTEHPELPHVFIIDDTTLEKTGKRMEFIGRVFDHTCHTCVLGYKLLTLSFFDGVSHIPLDFSLHAEKGKKGNYGMSGRELSKRYHKKRLCGTPGKLRSMEVDKPKYETALQMLRRAWKNGIHASYVLMDNWFDSHNFISGIRQVGNGSLHIICTVKKDRSRSFVVDGKRYTAEHIIATRERKYVRMCRTYKCRYILQDALFGEVPVRVFFIQYGKTGEWAVLMTTDRSLNFKKAFEYYQIRWHVEVMYRECKQYLRLGKCQSNDFDAQIADTTLAFMTYTMLSLKKRLSEYATIGELFRPLQRECLAMTLWQRILPLAARILEKIAERAHRSIKELFGKEEDNAQPDWLERLSINYLRTEWG